MSEHSQSYLVYTGSRDPDTHECSIAVRDLGADGSGWALNPRLDLANKSPTGFEWAYNGSGPAQTALAIMVSHLADPRHHAAVMAVLGISILPPEDEWLGLELHEYLAMRYFQQFKFRVVVGLPREGWELSEEDIERLIIETNKRPDQVTA
jgi:hypothetical protein